MLSYPAYTYRDRYRYQRTADVSMEITRALQLQEQQAKLLWYWQWIVDHEVGSVERKDEANHYRTTFRNHLISGDFHIFPLSIPSVWCSFLPTAAGKSICRWSKHVLPRSYYDKRTFR
jgi:hypothetical protein